MAESNLPTGKGSSVEEYQRGGERPDSSKARIMYLIDEITTDGGMKVNYSFELDLQYLTFT